MTSRRGFLGALAAAIAGPMVIDPEKLLWRPGAKLISIPKPVPSLTAERIIHDAYRNLGLIEDGGALHAADLEFALQRLNKILDNWNSSPLLPYQLAKDIQPFYAIS